MNASHIIMRDSFTRDPRAVAVNFSETARRANTAAILRAFRAQGYTARIVERGAMYTVSAPSGWTCSIWYSVPNRYGIDTITVLNIPRAR